MKSQGKQVKRENSNARPLGLGMVDYVLFGFGPDALLRRFSNFFRSSILCFLKVSLSSQRLLVMAQCFKIVV
jgi:hypothetical protein